MEENVGLCRGTNLGVYNAKYERIKQENLVKIGIINLAFFQYFFNLYSFLNIYNR
jgi:hypothetical protein